MGLLTAIIREAVPTCLLVPAISGVGTQRYSGGELFCHWLKHERWDRAFRSRWKFYANNDPMPAICDLPHRPQSIKPWLTPARVSAYMDDKQYHGDRFYTGEW